MLNLYFLHVVCISFGWSMIAYFRSLYFVFASESVSLLEFVSFEGKYLFVFIEKLKIPKMFYYLLVHLSDRTRHSLIHAGT